MSFSTNEDRREARETLVRYSKGIAKRRECSRAIDISCVVPPIFLKRADWLRSREFSNARALSPARYLANRYFRKYMLVIDGVGWSIRYKARDR